MSGNPVYTVGQVNQYIKSLLDGDKLRPAFLCGGRSPTISSTLRDTTTFL